MAKLKLVEVLREIRGNATLNQQLAKINECAVERQHPRKTPQLTHDVLSRLDRNDETVRLSISQLSLLDAYIKRYSGRSLSQIEVFVGETILDEIADTGEATVFVSLQAEGNRNFTSAWDTQALTAFLTQVNEHNRALNVNFSCIAPWNEYKQTDHVEICIGSSSALSATESILSELFSLEPNTTPPYGTELPHLLFAFKREVNSCCSIQAEKIDTSAKPWTDLSIQRIKDQEQQAILVRNTGKDEAYIAYATDWISDWTLSDNEYSEFGVIVAGRMEKSRLLIAAAGMSGPGTLAAMQCINKLDPLLDDHTRIAVVQATVSVNEQLRRQDRDPRELGQSANPRIIQQLDIPRPS